MYNVRENYMDIYMNASVIVEDDIYFTDCNTRTLYKKKILEDDIIAVTKLDVLNQKNGSHFSGMHYYDGCIWMMPWVNSNILIYDINADKQYELELPRKPKGREVFRRTIQENNYIWGVMRDTNRIIRINMEEMKCDIIEHWDKCGVEFSDSNTPDTMDIMDFKSICIDGDYIYAFRDAASKNVKINKNTLEISEVLIDTVGRFGNVKDGKAYIGPVNEFESLEIYDLNLPCVLPRKISLPNEIWEKHKYYAYWYVNINDNNVYILPHEAKGIIVYNIENESVKIVQVSSDNYRSLRRNKYIAGYEVHKYKEYDIITSYQGNEYIILDKNAEIVKECCLGIPADKIDYQKIFSTKDIQEESSYFNLEQWLSLSDEEVSCEKYTFDNSINVWNYTMGSK